MQYKYEIVKYNDKYPAKIYLQDKPGRRCATKLHWHEAMELLYIIDGSLNITDNNETTQLSSGDMYFVNHDSIHRTFSTEPEKNIKYLVVLLSYDYLVKCCPKLGHAEFEPLKSPSAACALTQLLKQTALAFGEGHMGWEIKVNALLHEIYYTLISSCAVKSQKSPRSSSDKELEHVTAAIEYMGKNYLEDLTLADVCGEVGLSPSYFSRCFKKITRVPVMQYLAHIRLESALREMIDKNKNVTDAAFDNGFTSVKSFIEMCKKVYSCTPGQYKNQNKN